MTRLVLASAALGAIVAIPSWAQEQAPNRRDITITARGHQFFPNRIDVTRDDLVRITLRSEDVPYGFAIDAYRVMKRVAGGQTITFEFRADQAGTFPFYCNLSADDRCAAMRGTLVVRPQ
ncbi:MAG: cupredoxin domain-containing protein [Acidobacteriota bacterium]